MMRYVVTPLALVVSGLMLHAIAADQPTNSAYRAESGTDADRQEIAELQDRIGELQAELDKLKGRLHALEQSRKPWVLTVPTPHPRPLATPIPPDWQRREFNGQEYFIIPLAKDPAAGKD